MDNLASGQSQPSSLRPSHPPKKSTILQPFRISALVASSPLDLRLRDDPRPRGFTPLSGTWQLKTVASLHPPSPSMGFAPLQGSWSVQLRNPVCLHTCSLCLRCRMPHRVATVRHPLSSLHNQPPRFHDLLSALSLKLVFASCCCQQAPPVWSLSEAIPLQSDRTTDHRSDLHTARNRGPSWGL